MVQLAALLLRSVIAIFAGLLIAGGTLTLAADRASLQRPVLAAAPAGPATLTVPQVSGQAYVFAKGILQDSGFAWRVSGPVRGFAGNTVADQVPAAGTVVLDTGAPIVTLTLAKNRSYDELGAPENSAPYHGTVVRIPANPLASRPIAMPKEASRAPTRTSATRSKARKARSVAKGRAIAPRPS
jgi:hypothetical protein